MLLADYCLREFYQYHGLKYDAPTLDDNSEENTSSRRYVRFRDKLIALLKGREHTIAETLYVMLPAFYAALTTEESDSRVDAEIDEYFAGYEHAYSPLSLLRPALEILQRKFFRQIEHVAPSLELGIGDGYASKFIFNEKLTVGTDPLLYSLLTARQRDGCETYAAIDMTRTPYADESFNTIYLVHTIDHIRDRLDALREIARVLRPGGRVALTDMTSYDRELLPLAHLYQLMGFPDQARDSFNYFLDIVGERRECYLPAYYYQHLADLGFTDIRVELFMSPQLTRLVGLQVELQFLLGFQEKIVLKDKEMREFYFTQGRRALSSLIASDEQLCAAEGKALNMFVTARKKGETTRQAPEVSEKYFCPECHVPLANYTCEGCGREYPVIDGIPLLLDFYADHWMRIKDHLPPAPSYRPGLLKKGLKRVPMLVPMVRRIRQWRG